MFGSWMGRSGLIALLALSALATGCGPRYVRGTSIEYTEEKQKLADVVERYRQAVEQRDGDAVRALVSRKYYENGSTTTTPTDDYDYRGLNKVLADLDNMVQAVRYKVTLQEIEVYETTATVDFEYEGQYMYTVANQDRWATASDRNRLTFRLEEGDWRIVSGL
jgi:hypothetical protein